MSDAVQDFEMEVPEPRLKFGDPMSRASEVSPDSEAVPKSDPAASLTPQEREKLSSFVEKIDVTDTAGVLSYGVGSQRKVSEFSERALTGVRGSNLGEIGDDISSLVVTLKNFDPKQDEGGLFGIFRKARNGLEGLKARYSEVERNVRSISEALEGHQRTLLKDISMLDQLYSLNEAYFKELTMYVVAGKEKLAQVREGMDAAITAALDGKDVHVARHALDGSAASLLIEFSTAVDLVVVGTRGRGGLAGVLLGSTSQTVLGHSTCPVMIVPSAHLGEGTTAVHTEWERR